MGQLTTHVLDVARGRPGSGMQIDLFAVGENREPIKSVTTNDDGRTDEALLLGDSFVAGVYELVFHVGAYYSASGTALPDPPFLDDVTIRFGIAEPSQHYHVPLLTSPWSYSTYRGS